MALVVGPLAVVIGIVAVFFVMRRKSVEKRSMYSARRSQIEHKVRAARQRTLAPRGHAEKPHEETIPGAAPTFAPQAPQATVTWATPAYEAPPSAPPAAPPYAEPSAPPAPPPPPPPSTQAPATTPWDVPAAATPTFDYPPAVQQPAYEAPAYEPPAYQPPASEPYQSAPEAAPVTSGEPAWTPAPAPAVEPAAQLERAAATASSTSAGGWSIVNPAGDEPSPDSRSDGKKKKDKAGAATASGDWSLASGTAPGDDDAEEPQARRPSGGVVAVVQYAIFVVGLVMVLIGVLVMVANSHVT